MNSEFVTVMYHFVADPDDTPWPGLVSCRTGQFKAQLDYLCRNYDPVTLDSVRRFCAGEGFLPAKGCLLTFDHGTRDHLDNVLPELDKRGLQGSFFVYTEVQEEGRIAPIDKQRYLEYKLDRLVLLQKLCEHALRLDPTLDRASLEPTPDNLLEAREWECLKPYPFYSDAERFLRKIRNTVLPLYVFTGAVSAMFAETFGDEAAFAHAHYLTWDDLAGMRDAGMEINGHGHRHLPMDRTPLAEQAADVERNTQLLRDRLHVPADAFAYPNGACNANTFSALGQSGVKLAFTTEAVKGISCDTPLQIGRLDTAGLLERLLESQDTGV